MDITFEPINLTKELILSRVSEEKILNYYLGLPVKKGLYRNPLRRDKRPTASYYRSSKSGRIMFKDFGTGFCGDFVSIVMAKFNCSYYKALQIIANDFGIITRKDLPKNRCLKQWDGEVFEDKQGAIIQVEIRDFTESDIQWWAKYGITVPTLKKFKVFSCKNVFLNGNLFETVLDTQHVYGYYGGIKQDVEQWRVYHPSKTKWKWISNWKNHQIQGAHLLPKQGGDILVITKSLKDCACLYEYGITAIAPCSENEFLTDNQYQRIKNKFNKIILLWDNDYAGISNAQKIRKQHPDLIVMFIPKKSGCKDFSDYRKTYGDKKTRELIQQAKDYYKL